MTTFDSENPEKLWEWMAKYEAKTGGHLLAIPHNTNLSNGRMFALNTFGGDPLTKAYADERQKFLTIIIQESERLTRLINQVLDLAKLESGNVDWDMMDTDLVVLMGDAASAVGQHRRTRSSRLSRSLRMRVIRGISSTHGPHHEAQRLIKVGSPDSAAPRSTSCGCRAGGRYRAQSLEAHR